MKTNKWLTQEEVDSLKDGDVIEVNWSGRFDDDVAEYIYFEGYACSSVEFEKKELYSSTIKGGELDFVGKDKPFTRVRLKS